MDKEKLSSEEMMVLVLKAQANHFAHLDQDLRSEMQALRQDTMREIALLREDMNRRFEQVDKRFEQVDKRFEQVDKRFEQIDMRFNRIYVFLQRMMGVLATSAVAMLIKLYFG